METIKFIKQRISKIEYSCKQKKDTQDKQFDKGIEFINTVNSNVSYNEDKSSCLCRMTFSFYPKNEDDTDLYANVVVEGAFEYDVAADKKEIHVNTAKTLYPYLRKTVTDIFKIIGFADFELPDIEFSVDLVSE